MTDNPGQGTMGTKLYITLEGVLTAIVHAEKLSYPELEKILNESTGHDAAGGYAQFADSGKRKMNAFTIGVRWDVGETTHAGLLAVFNSKAPAVFKAEDPDGEDPLTFSAHVQKIGRVTEQEGVLRANITIQPTGEPS